VTAMIPQGAHHAAFPLQLGDVDVEVHAADALEVEGDVIEQDFCD